MGVERNLRWHESFMFGANGYRREKQDASVGFLQSSLHSAAAILIDHSHFQASCVTERRAINCPTEKSNRSGTEAECFAFAVVSLSHKVAFACRAGQSLSAYGMSTISPQLPGTCNTPSDCPPCSLESLSRPNPGALILQYPTFRCPAGTSLRYLAAFCSGVGLKRYKQVP